MKKPWSTGLVIVGVVAILYIIYLRECQKPNIGVPEGYITISEQTWDSLLSIAQDPGDTIIIDTVYLPGKPVLVRLDPLPKPDSTGKDTLTYRDSIYNDEINVWVEITLEGMLLSWDWRYNPITKKVETIIEKPYPVPFDVEIPVYKREFFISGVIGGHTEAFAYGLDLDYINLKRNVYGLQYRRIGNENFVFFKMGTSLKFLNK